MDRSWGQHATGDMRSISYSQRGGLKDPRGLRRLRKLSRDPGSSEIIDAWWTFANSQIAQAAGALSNHDSG